MNHDLVKDLLISIGQKVCQTVYTSLKEQSAEERGAVYKEGDDDTIYTIDKEVEDIIVPLVEERAEELGGVVLIAEGIGEDTNGIVLPIGINKKDASIRIIMDPIDGTRGIMYDKRSAFYLSAAAPNKGDDTMLSHTEVAVMTELPTSKAYLSDTLYAVKGQGAKGITKNLLDDSESDLQFNPSNSSTILGGFAQISRFFPPGRSVLAKIEDELIAEIAGDEMKKGKAVVFEDQYISSGGQMYELLMGHDRFIADVRTALFARLEKEGVTPGHVCHPYDVCCILIAQEAGMKITDIKGEPLDARLNVLDPVDWIGYANEKIEAQVKPIFERLLKENKLI